MGTKETPPDLREGVRSGIITTLRRDADLRGRRTARLLAAAGMFGVAGALGVTLAVGRHPFDHHPVWHVALFSTVWAGLLVVNLALVFLSVRTPSLALGRAAAIAVLGVGLAGLCGALCPDQHFLHWWCATVPGEEIAALCGVACSAVCFGVVSSLFVALVATLLALGRHLDPMLRPALPAAMLFVLLLPGIALQSYGNSWFVFVGWAVGSMVGCYAGVVTAFRLRAPGLSAS